MQDNFSKSLDSLVSLATKHGKIILYNALMGEAKKQDKKSFTVDEIKGIYKRIMGDKV